MTRSSEKFYIVFNPLHHAPPKAQFHTQETAELCAELMANKFGDPFYVCETKVLFERPKAKKTVLK